MAHHIHPPRISSQHQTHLIYCPLAMPCILQPSGDRGKNCMHYTAPRKHELLAAAKRLQEEGLMAFQVGNGDDWQIQSSGHNVQEQEEGSPLWPAQPVEGNQRIPAPLQLQLQAPWAEDEYEHAIVALRASYLLSVFCKKSFTAQSSTVKQLIIAHSMTYWMGMHTLQPQQPKLRTKVLTTCNSCAASSLAAITTSVLSTTWTKHQSIFQWTPSACLSSLEKAIHICTLTDDTKQMTVAVRIAADGTICCFRWCLTLRC